MGKCCAVKEIIVEGRVLGGILDAVREYAIMKLMAALECGVPLSKVFGFDLVVNQDSVYFSAEKGIPFLDYTLRHTQQLDNNLQQL